MYSLVPSLKMKENIALRFIDYDQRFFTKYFLHFLSKISLHTCLNCGEDTVLRSSASVLGRDSPSGKNLVSLSWTSLLARIGIMDSGLSAFTRSTSVIDIYIKIGWSSEKPHFTYKILEVILFLCVFNIKIWQLCYLKSKRVLESDSKQEAQGACGTHLVLKSIGLSRLFFFKYKIVYIFGVGTISNVNTSRAVVYNNKIILNLSYIFFILHVFDNLLG